MYGIVFLIVLASTILVVMLVTGRSILYVDIRGKEWKWTPTKEEAPLMYWIVVAKLLFIVGYFSYELYEIIIL